MLRILSMKALIAAFAIVTSFTAIADHQHHAKHNMLLYGSDEIFAYHIVYKVPHNYQVILRVNFETQIRDAYLTAKENHPNDTFILLLDSMDIGKIAESEILTGTLLRRDSSGQQETIAPNVTLKKGNFALLYFDELPLSLAKDASREATAKMEDLLVAGLEDRFATNSSSVSNSCSIICRPITMRSDACSIGCSAPAVPVCRTHRTSGSCIAECFCRGGRG